MADDFDDYPETSLDDEAYDEFVRTNFGSDGEPKGQLPMGLWIAILFGLVLIASVYVLT